MFLILPDHRKYIKLLRDRANSGNPVVMTKVDYDDFLNLIRTTKKEVNGIDKNLLDELFAQAKSSPRLRMNYNFHQSLEDKCHRY